MQSRGDEWLATGDLASRNDAGEFIFTGRKSDVIVTSAGVNIHPQDLEGVLRKQAGLRASLIVAYDSPAGPTPAAVMIPDGDQDLQLAVEGANRELAPLQQIRYWLRWPQPEFPRTSTGKVLRRVVQSWAQQSLSASGTGAAPSDPLLEILHSLGAVDRDAAGSDRLSEDLHLDSLAMVQLQSTLETRFGLELDDMVWGQVRTVDDVRALLQQPAADAAAAGHASPRKAAAVFPRWPWSSVIRLLRIGFLETISQPLIWLVLRPTVGQPAKMAQPSLLIANHLTAFDVPVILYALQRADRDRVAVAMSGEILNGWRRGRAQKHKAVALLTPFAYWLTTAFFNVFPLPRGAGLRQSFAHAGAALDAGMHVLIFPEGRRSRDGKLQPFEQGIGLLAQDSAVPVLPIYVEGLGLQNGKWPRRGEVKVRFGNPLTMAAGEEPLAFTRRLEAAVAALSAG
jgi:long-chain acyl-CoA synthetase